MSGNHVMPSLPRGLPIHTQGLRRTWPASALGSRPKFNPTNVATGVPRTTRRQQRCTELREPPSLRPPGNLQTIAAPPFYYIVQQSSQVAISSQVRSQRVYIFAVSATPTGAPVAPIDNTFGAILIGNDVGLLMYGITIYQAYAYFKLYPMDTRRLKCLVFALVTLDTLHVIGSSHVCYFYLVTNYFNPAALLIGTWSAILMGVVMSVIIFVAQVFYVRRIYLLSSRYRGLVVVMVLLLVGELGAATFAAIEGSTRYQFTSQTTLTRIESTALVAVLVVDLFLASTLVVILHRTRTGFKRTDSLLNVLIAYTVNTCVLTSAINALALGFLIAFPTNMIYFGILTPATRSYTIAVLGVYVFGYIPAARANDVCHPRLNSRRSLLEEYNRAGDLFGLRNTPFTDVESGKGTDRTRVQEVSTQLAFKHSVTLVEDTLIERRSTEGDL
ncbi:hypothetical protein LXA43DRAFT_238517 [Ganoderma leucocontextum]|nr:hypothetical protein LXA43DRAFT_238517 [Ganoderma leucocontextum]